MPSELTAGPSWGAAPQAGRLTRLNLPPITGHTRAFPRPENSPCRAPLLAYNFTSTRLDRKLRLALSLGGDVPLLLVFSPLPLAESPVP